MSRAKKTNENLRKTKEKLRKNLKKTKEKLRKTKKPARPSDVVPPTKDQKVALL